MSGHGLIVIGASAGGGAAVRELVSRMPSCCVSPMVVVQHLAPGGSEVFVELLRQLTPRTVGEVEAGQWIEDAHVYVAPAGYHVLVERDRSLSLSVDARECYSRPSINVTMDTAARAYGSNTMAVLLTGANADGAAGMMTVRQVGGITWVQDPNEAECPVMPQAAIAQADDAGLPHRLGTLAAIAGAMAEFGGRCAPGVRA